MAIQKVNLGEPITGVGGDTYRQAHTKINANFSEIEARDTQLKAQIRSVGGGKKAYTTYALMEADKLNIPPNSSIDVTNDTPSNNGSYSFNGTVFTKSVYDAKTELLVLEKAVYGNEGLKLNPTFSLTNGYISTEGYVSNSNLLYQYTTPIFLSKATRITFNAYGNGMCALLRATDASITYVFPEINIVGALSDENSLKPIDFITKEDGYYILCSKTSIAPMNAEFNVVSNKSLDVKIQDAKEAAKKDLEEVKNFIYAPTEIVDTEAGGLRWEAGVDISKNVTVKAKEIQVLKGDVLTFNYLPFVGTTLWTWREFADPAELNKGIPLLTSTVASTTPKSFTYKVLSNLTLRLVNTVEGSILVNGSVPVITDVGVWGIEQYPAKHPFPNTKRTKVISVKKGNIITISGVTSGTIAIARVIGFSYVSILGTPINTPQGTSVSWIVDSNCDVILTGTTNAKIIIKNADNFTLEDRLAEFAVNKPIEPPAHINLPEKEYVFATSMNYILKTEVIDGISYIKISQNLGKSWTQMPNILGDIVSYHFFSEGTIMLCSPTKVYWTDDYVTLNESTVLDHDGSPFIPTSRHFFAMQTGDKIDYQDDTEIFSWGDYLVDGTPARVWYTTDRGRTIKCSIKFGTTSLGGIVRNVRHVHRVYFHKQKNTFYITTGDDGNENMIIKGNYTIATDTWKWEILNAGIQYKFGNIIIDDNNIAFMITDYTDPSLADKKGIYRVPVEFLGNINKYKLIYKCEPSEWGNIAPVSLAIDNNGNKILFPDFLGSGFLWIATEGLNFKRVTVSPNVLLTYMIGENYNGDMWCVQYEGGNNLRLSSGSFNLTKALRDSGITNFGRATTLISGLSTVVS